MDYLIYSGADLRNTKNIQIGKGVCIQKDVWIDCLPSGRVVIGKKANIGRRSTIGCGKLVEIGEKVLLGPNCYINDMDHEYRDIYKAIADQGITNPKPIKIGEGSWCGTNSVILASIGIHCVVGANSVVKKPVPSYTMVAGQPARLIKRYDFTSKKWRYVKWTSPIGLLNRVILHFHQRLP